MKKLMLVLFLFLVGCTCVTKDPQEVLPGWKDTRLEFDYQHDILIFVGESGLPYTFLNTTPGWYSISEPIENVMWCE